MENVEIKKPIYSSVIESFMENYIKDNSLENVQIVSRSALPKGNNFMGVINRVIVTGDKNGRDTEINFILKTPVSDEGLHNKFSQCLFFEREIYMYNEVANLYDEIQRNLPDAEKFKFPKYYFTNSAKHEQCILLVDLLKENFKPHHRLKRVDFEHASLAMEALGKMHAMSFYVQENMKEKFICFKETLDDVAKSTFCPDDRAFSDNPFFKLRLEEWLRFLDFQEYKEKLKQFMSNFYDHMTAASLPGPYTVIVHGDFWISNMLFKYENDKPIEVRLLDYQMSRFASPVVDVAHFIASSTDGEFRKLYYNDILEVYYNALSKHLSYFLIKGSKVYPRRVFYEQLKKYFAYGIGCSIISMANWTRDEADAIDMAEFVSDFLNDGGSKSKDNISELFKVRANELVRDCISYGYL